MFIRNSIFHSFCVSKTASQGILHFFVISLLGLALVGHAVRAQDGHHSGHSMGTVKFSVSCSEKAQSEFDQALLFLHHMTYPQAQVAFEKAAATDPNCAMAQWGIAMTLFQPLWPTRPKPDALQRGWDALQKAKTLKSSERELMFIGAAEAFFLEPASTDYWLRIRRWEDASQKVYAALPDDPEASVFYALSHLATTPSNAISRDHADLAAGILLKVYKQNPDHPGAMHYLVHANDVPGRENELLEITRKYESAAPRNPHALHMPTHIYTRLGDWDAVVRGNLRAAEAALEHPAGPKGEYVWDEFPHAIEYLVYAHLQKGADDKAAEQLKRLLQTERLEPSFKTAFHISSTQARYALERRAWKEAQSLAVREPANLDWDRFTWPEAITQFARGLGAAYLAKTGEARQAVRRLDELEAATQKAGEELFARNIKVMRLELSSWIAQSQGEKLTALALMREAAAVETSTPKHAVTPGPTLPAYEQLGDLLMEHKQPTEALAAYKQSLERYPKRFNSLLGAARAAKAAGDKATARAYYQQLFEVAGSGSRRTEIKEAKSYAEPSPNVRR